ncbi:DUF58 domain-containing protein [Streptomyces sp. NBC_00102]|uniref:DUF58 domain-containing protein n=1 Tax=Streptomyces sp. NBC_00102 TaxID=2975652 RepID=UPI002256E79A|nr:DUF58 domain-containing protein [Streptomyces sp. NBC_00102]MCX5396503.1 DUF58 domain-containing protein [Streptomyces sp. NBC_00102]
MADAHRGPGPRGGAAGDSADEGRGTLRAALGGLTTRGRSFLAAGVAAAVCAYVLGQADLLRVGLLLAVLPLVCAAALHRTHYRVVGTRRLSPSRVPAGSEARVHLRVDNASRLPSGLLMLQDRVPYVLGPRPRFVLDRVEPGGRREVSYRVRSDLRGRYPLGPLQLRLADPFGMCELTRSFSAHDTLVVIPRTQALPPLRLTGAASGYGDGRQRSLAQAGEDDVLPRGYRHGDDLRRVHWRSTARYGELMVRREEQPQRARASVLLDTRREAFRGSGPDSAFEWAVSAAASALAHLVERGFAVRLLTDEGGAAPGDGADGLSGSSAHSGSGLSGSGHGSADASGLMLDALAVVEHSDAEGLAGAYDVLRGGHEGLLLAFLGDLDEAQVAVAAAMRRRSGAAVAFVMDGEEWAPGAGQAPATPFAERLRLLREAGWTAVPVAPGADLARVWQQAGQPGDTQPAAGGAATGFSGGWS